MCAVCARRVRNMLSVSIWLQEIPWKNIVDNNFIIFMIFICLGYGVWVWRYGVFVGVGIRKINNSEWQNMEMCAIRTRSERATGHTCHMLIQWKRIQFINICFSLCVSGCTHHRMNYFTLDCTRSTIQTSTAHTQLEGTRHNRDVCKVWRIFDLMIIFTLNKIKWILFVEHFRCWYCVVRCALCVECWIIGLSLPVPPAHILTITAPFISYFHYGSD